jgi:hypothetical protein
MSVAILTVEQQSVLETIPEKEVQHTPVKENDKSHILEDCHSTDEGTFASPSSSESDEDITAPQCVDSEGAMTPEPSSSCASDDENNSGQDADVGSSQSSDSCPSGLNSSCASDDEDFSVSTYRESDQIPLAELPSVGSVGHYAGQCSRCCFFPKGRCTNGTSCNFCHLDHERVRRKRGGAKKAAKAAEEAVNSTENPKEEQAAHDPVAKKLDFKEAETTQETAFAHSSLQAKGEAVIHKMASTTMAHAHVTPRMSMPAMHPVPEDSYPSFSSYNALPRPAPTPVTQLRIPTPQCTRSSAPAATPPAELLNSKLLAVSQKRPVKVWVPPDVQPLKRLDASIPAKKKPSFPEYAPKDKKTLDPIVPCKKHMPSWLLNLDAPAAPKPKPQTFAPPPQAPVSTADPAPR